MSSDHCKKVQAKHQCTLSILSITVLVDFHRSMTLQKPKLTGVITMIGGQAANTNENQVLRAVLIAYMPTRAVQDLTICHYLFKGINLEIPCISGRTVARGP